MLIKLAEELENLGVLRADLANGGLQRMNDQRMPSLVRSCTWATKPAADSMPKGTPIFISDVGGWNGSTYAGSFWYASGGKWYPQGVVPLIHSGVPVSIPMSGDVTNGIYTPTVGYGVGRDSGSGVWCWFPASAGLPQGAGYYWCYGTSASLQVTDAFWSGSGVWAPYKPSTYNNYGALVGNGAFTQTTATWTPVVRGTIPGGVISAPAALQYFAAMMGGPSSSAVNFRVTLGSSLMSTGSAATTGSVNYAGIIQAAADTRELQIAQGAGSISSNVFNGSTSSNINSFSSENLAADTTLLVEMNLGTATNRCELTSLKMELVP